MRTIHMDGYLQRGRKKERKLMNELLLQILLVIVSLIGVLITYVLVPYLNARTTETQQKQIALWVQIAVEAAEQIINKAGAGLDKKAYVLSVLNEKGIKVTAEQLDTLIEAAVYQLNKAKAAATT